MSKRATIWVQKDNALKGIYCHNDGDIEHLGDTLLNYYNTAEMVEKLLALGDVSSIHSKLDPTPNSGHSYNNPEEDVTVAYHRDKGEKFQQYNIRLPESGIHGVRFNDMPFYEYNYIFNDGKWQMLISDGKYIQFSEFSDFPVPDDPDNPDFLNF